MIIQITKITRLGKIIGFWDKDGNIYKLHKDKTPSLFKLAYDVANLNRAYEIGEYNFELFPDSNIIRSMS